MTQLMIALDAPDACDFVPEFLEAGVKWFKFNAWALLDGRFPRVSNLILGRGGEFMLDLKVYDTRDTVVNISKTAFATGAKMLTVHAAPPMLQAAMNSRPSEDYKVIAVGALSDGHEMPAAPLRDLPVLPYDSCDGMVCSVPRANWMRRHPTSDMPRGKILVCPGIRLIGSPKDNHTLPSEPKDVAIASADFAVMGRPIYTAVNPVRTAVAVMTEIGDHQNVT